MEVAVFNPTWSSALAMKSAALTIAAATVGSGRRRIRCFLSSRWSAARPRSARCSRQRPEPGRAQLPLPISGPGIKRGYAGATAATYIPVSSDVGHTLTSTVVATGSPGAKSSATSAATVPIVAASPGSPPATVSGSVPFVALHTYYMSPTGSDSNNGLTAQRPGRRQITQLSAATSLVAAAGKYTSQFGIAEWGKVSNCPSTSGGIDGTGGIYFAVLLCAGPKITSCSCWINSYASEPFRVGMSNWAIEGFSASMSPTVTWRLLPRNR